jgi:hypothetical protein
MIGVATDEFPKPSNFLLPVIDLLGFSHAAAAVEHVSLRAEVKTTEAGNGKLLAEFCGVGFLVVWKKLPPPPQLRACTTVAGPGVLTTKKNTKKTEK